MGYYRFFAAFAVAINHLWGIKGGASVFCFYTLSGFLIAWLRTERYVSAKNIWRFLAARFLRLYPTYWTCLALSIAVLSLAGASGYYTNPAMRFPVSMASWAQQFFIFGLLRWPCGIADIRLLPSAWSLNIILIFYVIIGIFVGHSLKNSIAFFIGSIALVTSCLYEGATFSQLYFSLFGPAVAFAIGALYYHLGRYFYPAQHFPRYTASYCLVFLNLLLYAPSVIGFYLLYRYIVAVFSGFLVWVLHRMEMQARPSWLNKWAGDVSYPVFLLHWPVASVVATYLGAESPGAALFALTLLFTLAIGTGIILVVKRPLKRYRIMLRPNAGITHLSI